jgi:hypothetical protein
MQKKIHDPHANPTHFVNNKGQPHANWWTIFDPFIEQKNSNNAQTTFVYIVENQVMLLVNVPKNEVHIQHMLFLSLIQNLENWKTKTFNLNRNLETSLQFIMC